MLLELQIIGMEDAYVVALSSVQWTIPDRSAYELEVASNDNGSLLL
jgi:hypothetical protein